MKYCSAILAGFYYGLRHQPQPWLDYLGSDCLESHDPPATRNVPHLLPPDLKKADDD